MEKKVFSIEEKPNIKATFTMREGSGGTTDHNKLINRDFPDQHPISAITDLEYTLSNKQDNLTTEQQSAVDSGITSTKVGNYDNHIANKNNPHEVTKEQVGLGNVDNTSDLDKPISTATQTALTNLGNDISGEVTNRKNADKDLQSQIDALVVSSDVFDVVGTYAELQAYDISKVPVNDIIKVLVDSTHDNAATYYRCIENGDVKSWSYIGAEGAYYTKAEADGKFVPLTRTVNNKALSSDISLTASDVGAVPTNRTVNGKALSSDINLTASDVGALPDSTVIPTVNNKTITIQKNGTDVDSFTLNQTTDKNINIVVPTKVSDLQNDSGFTTNTGTVTSVRVQAGAGLTSSQSSAQTNTLDTTIGIDSNYKLPTNAEFNAKENLPTTETIADASVTLALEANKNYVLTNTAITDITLSSCETSYQETTIQFTTGTTAPSLTDSSGISWVDYSAPILQADKSYIICIWNKKGFYKEY